LMALQLRFEQLLIDGAELVVRRDAQGRISVGGLDLAGRFVLISPVSAWPQNLVYTVNGTNSSSEFKVQACNRRTRPATPAPTVAEATYTFNYAVIGP